MMRLMKKLGIALLLLLLSVSVATAEAPTATPNDTMTVTSAGIVEGVLADAYGKKGEDLSHGIPTRSMPLSLSNLPADTACLAIEMVDPDGGDWVHWLAVNLPTVEEIPENASVELAADMLQGKNSFGKLGYGGPTPPSGTHGYIITVYALSQTVELKEGFSQKQFHAAIDDCVLVSASVTGNYSKK